MLEDMKQDAKFKPTTPPATRIYAIGDVHGRLDLLDALLAQIAKDANAMDAPERLVLVLLGDLIDRGPHSQGVVQRAYELVRGERMSGFEIHVLKGNHEQAMLQFLAGENEGTQWLANGGIEALASYGINAIQAPERLRQAFQDALPQTHRRLLRDLALTHVEGDYAFVHAGVRPGVAWTDQREEDLLWIRREFTDSMADFGYFVVHGHSARDTPEVCANRANIDTRAWSSGVLTCLVLQGQAQRFLST